MSKKTEFILELTRQEALALVLYHQSNRGTGFVAAALKRMGDALLVVDGGLRAAQFDLWAQNGQPTFGALKDDIPLPKDWV